jgi:UDP-N-acetylmuramyl pentapeptide phosphotransferase/UDP-N-acetylglucosamine-1-phosphate transferase
MLAVLFVAGAVASALLWAAMRPTFADAVFGRENHRGVRLPTGVGVVVAVAAVAVEAVVTVVDALGADVDADTIPGRRLALLAAVGFALLGLLDDVAGVGQSGGFRGHLRAVASGRLTTGAVKLFGGAALAVVVVAAGTTARPLGRLVADAALVALAANLGNLLDRAPGRVGKSVLAATAVLVFATGFGPELAGVALVVGAGAGLLVADLRERCMLGDAGANALGAAVGVGVVLACSPGVRLWVLAGVAALNVASEAVSFSRVIRAVPPLRWLDDLGRTPSPRPGPDPGSRG